MKIERKSIKRILALALTVVMAASCFVYAAGDMYKVPEEGITLQFTAPEIGNTDYSDEKSDVNRGLVTVTDGLTVDGVSLFTLSRERVGCLNSEGSYYACIGLKKAGVVFDGISKDDINVIGTSLFTLAQGYDLNYDTIRIMVNNFQAHDTLAVVLKFTVEGEKTDAEEAFDTYKINIPSSKGIAVKCSNPSAFAGETVALSITLERGYAVQSFCVKDGDGNEVALQDMEGGYRFLMPTSDVFVEAEAILVSSPFVDVVDRKYYYDPILWAADSGITTGIDGFFYPNDIVTRAQMVTFLWRAAGSPEASLTETSFADVIHGSYYEKAALWAEETGIVKGIDGRFEPNTSVTRAQAVTMLMRLQDGEPTTEKSFVDVNPLCWFAGAAGWAQEQGIATGIDGYFKPNNLCTRGEIVTFLYRVFNK